MVKLRFLQCIYLKSLNIVANFNDEYDIEDENFAKQLVDAEVAEQIFKEEEIVKIAKTAKKVKYNG